MRAKKAYGGHQPKCQGRCLVANPQGDNLIWMSVILVLSPAVVCLCLVNPELSVAGEAICHVVVGGLLLCCLISLFLTRYIEPGILVTERNTFLGKHQVVSPTGSKHELTDFRAKFCRETDNCIENFDHYCPWVGNAVGIRNYSYFFLFVSCAWVLDVVVDIICWAAVGTNMKGSKWNDFTDSLKHEIPALLLIIYTIIIGFSISPLFFFHAWLIANNQTTNENIKGRWDVERNPHNKGCWLNCLAFWRGFGRKRRWVVDYAPQAMAVTPPV